MTDATISTASADIEATIKAAVAKALADAKAEETAWIGKVKAFVAANYSKVIAVAAGWAVGHFNLIEAAFKLI